MAGVQRRLPQPGLRPLPRRPGRVHRRRNPTGPVGLQRRRQPAVDRSAGVLSRVTRHHRGTVP
ncbi:hypothetical protein OG798_04520 [Streptomyces sp. NBC_00271]